jgi:uncharacterized protein YggE
MRLIVIGLIFLTTIGRSQNVHTDRALNPTPFIEVAGTATLEIVPDKILVSVVLSEKNNDNDQNNISKQEQSLQVIIQDMAIPKSRISLSDASSEIVEEKRRDKIVKVSKEYLIELKSASEVSTLLSKLSQAEIKESAIRSVEHSKIDSLRKEVRIMALKAAKEKAIYLTASIGEQIDKALEIREVPSDLGYAYYEQRSAMSNNISFGTDPAGSGTSQTDFKTLKIKFTYQIKYSLK